MITVNGKVIGENGVSGRALCPMCCAVGGSSPCCQLFSEPRSAPFPNTSSSSAPQHQTCSNYSSAALCRVRKITITQGNFIYVTNFFHSYHFKLGQNALWFVTWSKTAARATAMCARRELTFFCIVLSAFVQLYGVSKRRKWKRSFFQNVGRVLLQCVTWTREKKDGVGKI